MNSRRVLLVSASSGSMGGGELYLVTLAEGLVGLGHEVQFLMGDHPRMDALAALGTRWGRVHRTQLITNTYDRRLRSLGAVFSRRAGDQLADLVRGLRPDVVHLNKQNLEDGLDVLTGLTRSEFPTVCTIHVTRTMAALGGVFARVRDRVARCMLARADCDYLITAAACRRQFDDFLGGRIDPGRVHLVLNGVAMALPGDRDSIRAEWGCRAADVVLGCVARIEAQKDPLFALDVLNGLPPHVHLAWVGDGRLRTEFEQKVDRLGLSARVHLDGWRSDARARMAGFDIFILPSVYEGFPFAVLEAMAAGLPIVASDVDGIREAVVDGGTGWLCPPGDPAAWTARLTAFVTDPEARSRIRQTAVERYWKQFSLEAMAEGTAAVYETAIRRAVSRLLGVSQ